MTDEELLLAVREEIAVRRGAGSAGVEWPLAFAERLLGLATPSSPRAVSDKEMFTALEGEKE